MSQDPRWIDDTVELLARAIASHSDIIGRDGMRCGCDGLRLDRAADGEAQAEWWKVWRRHRAEAVLAVLDDAGLLAQDDNRSPECMTGGRLHDDCDNDLGCTCGCHANGTSGPQSDEQAPPRVWAMPPEPGPDVTRVRDVHGQCFTRADAPLWVGDTFADDEDVPDLYLTWKQLMGQDPLTEVVEGSQT